MFETWYKMTVMLESGLDISPVITHRFPGATMKRDLKSCARRSRKVILDWSNVD